MSSKTILKPFPGQLNSVQLNIVTVIDLHKAVATGTTRDALYMMDNSVGGPDQGTGHLQTVCQPGQVINWIIYPMDMEKRPNGTWPPMPKIVNIVFLENDDSELFSQTKICSELKIYGGPDMIRSPYTPVYYYWAGIVATTITPGVYHYRLVLELEQEGNKEKVHLNSAERPSLQVIAL